MVSKEASTYLKSNVLENTIVAQTVAVLKRDREKRLKIAKANLEVGMGEPYWAARPKQLFKEDKKTTVAIARALSWIRILMLFDEPTSALD